MTKSKSIKSSMISSVVALLLCFTMLLGTTFAWFTDSAISSGNIVQSGTLGVEMYWAEGNGDVPTDLNGWKDASKDAIFNYDNWEPGYTDSKHIKIVNVGNVAFQYSLSIIPNGAVSELAEVIDVYYVDQATKLDSSDDMSGAKRVGTLADMINDADGAAYGIILPKDAIANDEKEVVGEKTVTIALKMREEAGNEYQTMSIGTDFSVRILATQYTYENDSFNNQYDVDATYPIYDADGLREALAKGGIYSLFANITVDANCLVVPEGVDVKLNLNGYNIDGAANVEPGETGNQVLFYVKSGANLTVYGNGSIVMTTTDNATARMRTLAVANTSDDYMSCVFFVNSANLTISEGVTVDNKAGVLKNGFVIDVVSDDEQSAVIDLNGAVLSSYYSAIRVNSDGLADITVYADDCTITSAWDGTSGNDACAVWMKCSDHSNHDGAEHRIFLNNCAVNTDAIKDDCADNGHGVGCYNDGDIVSEMKDAITVHNSAELASALVKVNNGKTILLAAGEYTLPNLGNTIDGFTIVGTKYARVAGMAAKTSGFKNMNFQNVTFTGDIKGTFSGSCTIKNCTFDEAGITPSCYVNNGAVLTIENCTFNNSPNYAIHFGGKEGGTVIVKNSTFNDCTVINPTTVNFSMTDCDFNNVKVCAYGPIKIAESSFDSASKIYIHANTGSTDVTVTMNGCIVDGGADITDICYDTGNNNAGIKQFVIDGITYNHSDMQAYT